VVNQYLKPNITVPSSLVITAITRSNPMIVSVEIGDSTTEANTYIPGMQVRLQVPQSYRMFQANNLIGTITAVNGSDFTIDRSSSLFDAFVVPSGNVEQPATLAPYGSRNLEYNNSNSNIVPFKALNNIGN